MSSEHSEACQAVSVPHLNGVISETRNDFLIVILEAIDAFGIFTATIYSLEVMFATSPIVLNGINVLNNRGIQSTIKAVIWVVFARFWLE